MSGLGGRELDCRSNTSGSGGKGKGQSGRPTIHSEPGRRCAGYVVLLGSVALLHHGLARESELCLRSTWAQADTVDSRPAAFLPQHDPRNRLGHHLLLGRPDGLPRKHPYRPDAIQRGLLSPHGPRRFWPEDVEIPRERHRSVGHYHWSESAKTARRSSRWKLARSRDKEGRGWSEEIVPQGYTSMRNGRPEVCAVQLYFRRYVVTTCW
jgi:hypothetical protein